MRKHFFILLAFCALFAVNSNAQRKTISELLSKLNKCNIDTAKANCLNAIAQAYLKTKDDSAIYFSNKALVVSQKSNYTLGKAKAYINMTNAYRHLDSTKKSLSLIALIEKENLISKIENKSEQNKTQADWLYAKARLYENLDSLEYAKKMYNQSLSLSEKENYTYLKTKNYIGLRFIAYKQGHVKDAIKYAFSSIPLLEKTNDYRELMKSYNLIATLYGQLNENKKSIEYHFKSLEYAKKLMINNKFPSCAAMLELLITRWDIKTKQCTTVHCFTQNSHLKSPQK